MGRKRKLILGTTSIGGKALKSRRKAREVTSQYHNIQNELSILTKNHAALPKVAIEKSKSELLKKLDAIGGVDKYQQASIISTAHFKTSRWVISVLESLGRKPSVQDDRKTFHVLEVGAINIQLQQCDWMSVRSIDLHSQHPSIEGILYSLPPLCTRILLLLSSNPLIFPCKKLISLRLNHNNNMIVWYVLW